jgi:tetratricopeptide (TPR) repeat protein
MTTDSVLDKADDIMSEAVEKAGELMSEKPRVAEIILKQLLKCDPEHLAGLQLLGLCKHRMGENEEAVEIIQTALDLDPGCADNWNNLGLAYAGMETHDRAIAAIQKAIALKPNQFLFKNNLALQYRAVGDFAKAVETMRAAIASEERPQLWLNLGGIYGEMRDIAASKECFERAAELDPSFPAAHVDLAFVYHLSGDWQSGFREYEWRFLYYPQMQFYLNAFDRDKLWGGVGSRDGCWQHYEKGPDHDLTGKTLLVYGEQGMGDIIQFSRFAKRLRDEGAKVVMHVPGALASVVSRIDGVAGVNTRDIFKNAGEEFPPYDYQISLMSAPHLLGVKEITGEPYISPTTTAFRDHMKQVYPDTFNVGVVWAGNPSHPHDRKRSIPLKHLQPIHDVPGVRLFSLQMDLRKRQYGATYRSMTDAGANVNDPCNDMFQGVKGIVDYCEGCDGFKLTDLTQMIQSFEDTCTILAGLDMVICCDTATAHLAGAMGVPVWVMVPYNPDWRWGLAGDTTMWYDSMRLFRQTERDDWAGVAERVTGELREVVLQNQ